jgi:hypothetical protein
MKYCLYVNDHKLSGGEIFRSQPTNLTQAEFCTVTSSKNIIIITHPKILITFCDIFSIASKDETSLKNHTVSINLFNTLALISECMTARFLQCLEFEEVLVIYATSLPKGI